MTLSRQELLLRAARAYEAGGELKTAAERWEAAGAWKDAARCRAELGEWRAAAELLEKGELWLVSRPGRPRTRGWRRSPRGAPPSSPSSPKVIPPPAR